MTDSAGVRDLIDDTPWVDTHEHLVEEERRRAPGICRFVTTGHEVLIADDWTALLVDYAMQDLRSAGLSEEDFERVRRDELSPVEKWEVVADHFEAARATGYLRAVDLSTERLFGARLSRSTCEDITVAMRRLKEQPFYERVLRGVANVERCHVHSLDEEPFRDTDDPLILHDLALYPLLMGRHENMERASGIEVRTLDDYLDVVEWAFETFGPRAVAAKCNWAYVRSLDVAVTQEPPRAEFVRLRHGVHTAADKRLVEDHLFSRSIEHATRLGLPVKLHLGYLNGINSPEMAWVFDLVRAAAELVARHPRTKFVLMHIAWPQQEQLMSLAKQSRNVTLDLCWAWILAPRATRDFVARFLTTVPANKLLCFGGDFLVAENVVGHAEIARRGLQSALDILVDEAWLTPEAAVGLIEPLMRGNAEALFPTRRTALAPQS
jgi:hypothetical protein